MSKRKRNIVESITNTASGFLLSIIIGWVAFPLFGYERNLPAITGLTFVFSVASIARNYFIRSLFDHFNHEE